MDKLRAVLTELSQATVEKRLAVLARDFEVEIKVGANGTSYKLGEFKGFTGQADHDRHSYMSRYKSKIS